MPPSAPYMTKVTTFVAVNRVEENRSSGSIGARERRSHRPNAASRAAPHPIAASTPGLPQPLTGPSISPYVTPTSPRVTRVPPVRSTRPVASASWDSGTCRHASSTTAAEIGRLIPKISRHDAAWMSHPPRNGPMAVATPPRPDQAPIAFPRSLGANDASRIARLPGVSSAAPTPCSARAAISTGAVGARPHSREAMANHTTPMTNTRRRPYRSPRDPPSSSSPDSVSVYAVTTHCSVARPLWKFRPIAGSAMPTTVASIAAIPEPSTVAAITQRPVALLYLSCAALSTLDTVDPDPERCYLWQGTSCAPGTARSRPRGAATD